MWFAESLFHPQAHVKLAAIIKLALAIRNNLVREVKSPPLVDDYILKTFLVQKKKVRVHNVNEILIGGFHYLWIVKKKSVSTHSCGSRVFILSSFFLFMSLPVGSLSLSVFNAPNEQLFSVSKTGT